MANKGNKQQNNSQKAERKNTGNRGAKRSKMTPADLVLLEKGQFQTIQSVSGTPWRGVEKIGQPFDAKQAQINMDNGWC